MKRRKFLQYSGLTAGFSLGSIPVWASNKLQYQDIIEENDNILVVIQMFGGNDGLNTVIPADDGRYYSKYRPNVNVPQSKMVKIKDGIFLNTALTKGPNEGLYGLFKDGNLAVLQGIGYENPNLSHFRSTDIWLSGIMPNNDSERLDTGWIGRFSEKIVGGSLPEHPVCMNIGSSSSLLFQSQKGEMAISVENPNDFYERGKDILSGNSEVSDGGMYGTEHNFLLNISVQSNKYSAVVKKAFDAGKNQSKYEEKDKLANELKLVARLISGGLKSKMYLVSIDGFDTHASQGSADGKHSNLLTSVSQAVSSFMDDLKLQNLQKKVVGMTVSEFGRRPEENASAGTDHGAASVMFVFGEAISGGTFGKNFSFDNLNSNKDFQFQFDYRRVYDDVLINWFKADDQTVKSILNKRFDKIERGLFSTKQALSTEPKEEMQTSVYPNPTTDRQTTLRFSLKKPNRVSFSVSNISGRIISNSPEFYLPNGTHEIPINVGSASGQYLVRLKMDEEVEVLKVLKV